MKNIKIDIDKIANISIITQDIECPIDLSISLDPVMCVKCNQIYCLDCAESIKLKKCPLCNDDQFQWVSTRNTIINYEIENFIYKCINIIKGCVYIGKLTQIQEHEKECLFNTVKCKCLEEIVMRNIDTHILSECQLERLSCLYCMKLYSFSELVLHVAQCRESHFLCVFCGRYHKKEGEEVVLACRFKLVDCGRCKLKDISLNFIMESHVCYDEIKTKEDFMLVQGYYLGVYRKVKLSYKYSFEERLKIINDLRKKLNLLKEKFGIYNNQIYNRLLNILENYNSCFASSINKRIEDLKDSKLQIETKNFELNNSINQYKHFVCQENDQFFNNKMKFDYSQEADMYKYLIDRYVYQINELNKKQIEPEAEKEKEVLNLLDNKEVLINENEKEQVNQVVEIVKVCVSCEKSNSINKCEICNSEICLSCSHKCFFKECKNYFCNTCFEKNKHQMRKETLDCKLTRCKECMSVGFCLMTTKECDSCEKRICKECFFHNHIHHK